MSFHTPAHKQKQGDQTLADYIERKAPEKKLTFDGWLDRELLTDHKEVMLLRRCWDDAQRNK